MPVELQVLSVFAGTSGALDDLEIGQIRRFETDMHEWFQARHGDMVDQIRTTGTLPEGDAMADAMADFKLTFAAALTNEAAQQATADTAAAAVAAAAAE
jgi:F-type H+-transporting ATPase subunit alpha